ncbi:MAG: serine/threonine protein kinase/formylglycine-generating enzyme required for sulfatase activity [Planctomycetota bacterium]|jgi:serine/threonine protein kinase/formylglycine-generating enzyme required for sulfatase activity
MPDDSKRHAAELFTRFLATPHEDLEDDFELLCKQHPNEADELRGLYAMHRMFEDDLAVFKKGRKDKEESAYAEGARVGDTIGDFKLVSRIASGGQGEVWEAEQRSLSRRVALKLVLPDRINEKTLALFAREARAGGRLAHPGIVSVHGYGEDDGKHWIAQELVEGAWTLRDFIDEIRNEEELPENYYRAVAIFVAELADALQAAHDAGVIHRDVKPQNVLVTPQDHPKLTDFGLARITDETAVSMTGDFAGTWLYMSPEQVTAKRIEVDHRTDIFSLGIVMYEMLALVRPFDGDTTHQIAENIVYREPPDLRKIKSRVPRDLAVICAKALEKIREGRYQSMAEMAADLRRHLANEPIHAQPPTMMDRAVKWVRRNPTKSFVSVVVGVAFVVISGLGMKLAKSNTSLETEKANLAQTNNRLSEKTAEAEASAKLADENAEEAMAEAARADDNATRADAEKAEAERKTTDVLRLSLSQDYEDLITVADGLWPPLPEKIDALNGWIEEANKLRKELPALERKQAELRATAIPQTEEERQAERAAHPDLGKLDPLRAEIEAKRFALAIRRGEAEVELPTVDWDSRPSGAVALRDEAWELVKPNRDVFGKELLGLVLVQRALEDTPEAELSATLRVLAHAHLAVGEDEAALDVSNAALESAMEGDAEEAGRRHEELETAVTAAAGDKGLAESEAELSELESDLLALELQVNQRQVWAFPAEKEAETRARWWHNQITGLIGELGSLSAAGTGLLDVEGLSEEHGWSVARRLALAERLRDGFAEGGEFAQRWERDLPAIREAYPGLILPIQPGLVPIGPDPLSGLWEFWDVQSGTEPLRGEGHKLVLEESSGLVFVLLPGGKFWMGAQSTDPAGQNYDKNSEGDEGPPHEVELSAFFMSKYEMTQGQWKELTGWNQSQYGPNDWSTNWARGGVGGDLLQPVTNVTWVDCESLADRWGLRLPSEAQWEYGCRGGTTSVHWSGSGVGDLQGVGNIADSYSKDQGAPASWPFEEELDDGYTVHAPVDALSPNAFGLHHVHGNVWEWCLDGYGESFYSNSPALNPVNPYEGSKIRVFRGGSFSYAASEARSAVRHNNTPSNAGSSLGLRPVRVITK